MSAQTLAAQLAEAQADLAAVIGAEQRALEKAGNYRAPASEQETRQAEAQYLNASVQQIYMARGYAKAADELNARVTFLRDQIEDARLRDLDNAEFLARLSRSPQCVLTAEQMAAMDETAGAV